MGRHLSVFFALILLSSAPSFGQSTPILPTGFTATELVSGGFSGATSMCVAPNGTVYIALKSGAMRVWRVESGLLSTQFFANQPLDVNTSGERGLIGVALDPNFEINRYAYVHYTVNSTPRHGRISRFTTDTDGNLAIAGSEAILLDLDSLSSNIHNGGALHFGPDGMLYVGVGDNQVGANAQSINNLLGKILRIKPIPSDVIPSDNPTTFSGIAGSPVGNNRAIWALGLRNPFTFAIQPGTGRMMINDVGASAFEELNEGVAGRNYGWPITEGPFDTMAFPNFTPPFHAYAHGTEFGDGGCVVGGVFYNPVTAAFPPGFMGDYFFADYWGSGWIRRMDMATREVFDFAWYADGIVDLQLDSQGRLLVLTHGKLRRVEYLAPIAHCRTPERDQLIAMDAEDGDGLGAAIALSNDTLVVGAPTDDTEAGIDAGSAYVFTRNGSNWMQQAKLAANDGANGNWFGSAVAINADRILIGAPRHSHSGLYSAGAAYVFARNTNAWTFEAKLVAVNAGEYDDFGAAVALLGDTVFVGARTRNQNGMTNVGATYVFNRIGANWEHHSTLTVPDPVDYAEFGHSISAQDERVLIGAPGGNAGTGCAYYFERIGGIWHQHSQIIPLDATLTSVAGLSVALAGDRALIGAPGQWIGSATNPGAAYMFTRSGENWTQAQKLTAPDPWFLDGFGYSVSLSDDRAWVGAPFKCHEGEFFHGAAFVFARSNAVWVQEARLAPSDASQNDYFGYSLAVDNSIAIAGAFLHDHEGAMDAGSVYIFNTPIVLGDIDGDADLDLADASEFVEVLTGLDIDPVHQARADLNCDGIANGLDITSFVDIMIGDPP